MEEGGCLLRQPPPVGMMPPQPAIPCRVAPQQSPTPFRQTEPVYPGFPGREWGKQMHPVRFPGKDGFDENSSPGASTGCN